MAARFLGGKNVVEDQLTFILSLRFELLLWNLQAHKGQRKYNPRLLYHIMQVTGGSTVNESPHESLTQHDIHNPLFG